MLLDTLKPDHIENILKVNPGIQDEETCKHLAALLYQRTSGVPRFVKWGVDWLKKKGIGPESKIANIPADIFGDKFRLFISNEKGGAIDLNPMKRLPEPQKDTYIQLINLSSCGIPLEVEKDGSPFMINPAIWNLPHITKPVPLLEILRQYNLYIEKSLSDNQWRIIFPDMVIDQIALEAKDDRLPFAWIAFSKTAIGWPWKKGKLLETMTSRCLVLSLMQSLGFEASSGTYEERFPFLRNSLVGKAKITFFDKVKPIRRFPKIVTVTGSGGVALLGKPPSDRHTNPRSFNIKVKMYLCILGQELSSVNLNGLCQ